MFTINNIYFNGNSYANWLKNNEKDVVFLNEEYSNALECNMKKVDSIEFIDLNNNYCDIRIDNYYFFGVSKSYLLISVNEDFIKLDKRLKSELSNETNIGDLY